MAAPLSGGSQQSCWRGSSFLLKERRRWDWGWRCAGGGRGIQARFRGRAPRQCPSEPTTLVRACSPANSPRSATLSSDLLVFICDRSRPHGCRSANNQEAHKTASDHGESGLDQARAGRQNWALGMHLPLVRLGCILNGLQRWLWPSQALLVDLHADVVEDLLRDHARLQQRPRKRSEVRRQAGHAAVIASMRHVVRKQTKLCTSRAGA